MSGIIFDTPPSSDGSDKRHEELIGRLDSVIVELRIMNELQKEAFDYNFNEEDLEE